MPFGGRRRKRFRARSSNTVLLWAPTDTRNRPRCSRADPFQQVNSCCAGAAALRRQTGRTLDYGRAGAAASLRLGPGRGDSIPRRRDAGRVAAIAIPRCARIINPKLRAAASSGHDPVTHVAALENANLRARRHCEPIGRPRCREITEGLLKLRPDRLKTHSPGSFTYSVLRLPEHASIAALTSFPMHIRILALTVAILALPPGPRLPIRHRSCCTTCV